MGQTHNRIAGLCDRTRGPRGTIARELPGLDMAVFEVLGATRAHFGIEFAPKVVCVSNVLGAGGSIHRTDIRPTIRDLSDRSMSRQSAGLKGRVTTREGYGCDTWNASASIAVRSP